ncbi:MAG TPA: hypothetical protein VKS79_07155 [Gemmataceae bacterium]|nr:hypothetical protein [Gemmataceae bacterium]
MLEPEIGCDFARKFIEKRQILTRTIGWLDRDLVWKLFIMTGSYFGWRPTFFGFKTSAEYDVIPLDLIARAEIRARGFPANRQIVVKWWGKENQLQTMSFNFSPIYTQTWIEAFEEAGIILAGAERCDARTFKGFLRNYAWLIWPLASIATIATICQTCWALWPAHTGLAFALCSAGAAIAFMSYYIYRSIRS